MDFGIIGESLSIAQMRRRMSVYRKQMLAKLGGSQTPPANTDEAQKQMKHKKSAS